MTWTEKFNVTVLPERRGMANPTEMHEEPWDLIRKQKQSELGWGGHLEHDLSWDFCSRAG